MKKTLLAALLAGLVLLILYIILADAGHREEKIYRVGVVSGLDFFSPTVDGFKAGLAELGYIEGRNISYEVRTSNIDPVAEQQAAEKFIADRVDLILSFPTEASLTVKQTAADSGIPVVFTNSSLDGGPLVDSVAQPGGNITGVQFPTADNAVQRLEIFHEIVPNAKRFWVLYLQGYPIVPAELALVRARAASLGLTIIEGPAASPADVQELLDQRDNPGQTGIDAILIIPEPLTVSPDVVPLIMEFAARHKIPVGGAYVTAGDYGSLFGYLPDAYEVGQRAAGLAHKIFTGTPAGRIPVESPEHYLLIDYKLATELGIEINEGLLRRAKKIVR